MKPKVYIETTIPSFYFENRKTADAIARKRWTREWWDDYRNNYLLVTSIVVLDELSSGAYSPEKKNKALSLITGLPIVPVNESVLEIVRAYIHHKVMPENPIGDALHLSLASYHKCDFLLTWNCKHLANANKFSHIRRINSILGIFTPNLVTPLEMIGA